MSDHPNHLVQWRGMRDYILYCLTCGQLTAYTTQAPNSLDIQRFEQATAKPETITITLQVQSLKHKNRAKEI